MGGTFGLLCMITKNIVPGSIRASVRGIDLKVKERLRYSWTSDGSRRFEVVGFDVSGSFYKTTEIVHIEYLKYPNDGESQHG